MKRIRLKEFLMMMHFKNGSKLHLFSLFSHIYIINIFYRSEYEHPLVVGNVKRKAQTKGIEIKTVNDWQQFVDD